jgi:hypothetical protein
MRVLKWIPGVLAHASWADVPWPDWEFQSDEIDRCLDALLMATPRKGETLERLRLMAGLLDYRGTNADIDGILRTFRALDLQADMPAFAVFGLASIGQVLAL